jgi:hypothetical protein
MQIDSLHQYGVETIYQEKMTGTRKDRQQLEELLKVLRKELKTGDIGIKGSEEYADYREQLLSWEECKPMVADYCNELGFNSSSTGFVTQLKEWLTQTAETMDRHYPENGQVMINENGEPTLKRLVRKDPSKKSKALENIIIQRLPERNVLDILYNVEHWTRWTRHFSPLSGSVPNLKTLLNVTSLLHLDMAVI